MSTPRPPEADGDHQRFVARLARSWLWFIGLWCVVTHEFGRAALAAAPLLRRTTVGALLVEVTVLVVLGGLWIRRHGGLSVGSSATAMRLAALGAAMSPWAVRIALRGGVDELVIAYVWLPSIAVLLGVCLLLFWRDFGEASLSLGVIPLWLNPWTLSSVLVVLGLVTLMLGRLDFGRSLPIFGLALMGAASTSERLAQGLYGHAPRRSPRWRHFPGVVVLTCIGLLIFAPPSSSLDQKRRLEATPVYSLGDAHHHLEVTTAQSQSQWLIDGELQFSSMDYPRYYETLVHPALLRAPRLGRVVAFSNGLGLLEREILRYPEVRRLDVVVDTTLGPRAYEGLEWLREASHRALDDERVRIVPGEAIGWLEASGPLFDAAIIDLPDPTNYYSSKYFTRIFFRLLSHRLAPDAVIAMQVTSSERAAAILLRTADAAGYAGELVEAPVPTMGLWHFLVAARGGLGATRRELPARLAYLTPETLGTLELGSPRRATLANAPLSLLHDQTAMDAVVAEALAHPRR